MTQAPELLRIEGLSKSYPGVKACDDISFAIAEGEIHALLGENGAGKSTLVKMIYGAVRPDSGHMLLRGKPFAPARPADARANGIGMVFQHFSLFEALTVEENVALGLTAEASHGDLRSRIIEISKSYGLDIHPGHLVGELSVGERQRIEIVRCLLQNPRLIIMDEPTSVLTPREATDLFRTLRQLASEGCAVLYISHKLEEIRALCHHATILRQGRVVATCIPKDETARALAEMMIGGGFDTPARTANELGPVRLEVKALSLPAAQPFGTNLNAISFSVMGGEILGIAGVAGNGQNELVEALGGERLAKEPGTIVIDGTAAGRLGVAARRSLGLAYVPEERLGHGAVPDASLTANVLLSQREHVSKRKFIDWQSVTDQARAIIKTFDVRTPGPDRAARSLSGGNLQKFVVGREIASRPSVFIACQPTWGVDAGAAAAIHRAVLDLAANGTAVVVVSQDLDELFAISTHLAVLAGGSLGRVVSIEDATVELIGREMEGRSHSTAGGPASSTTSGVGQEPIVHA